MQAADTHSQEWANVDVHQRIRQFQTRINKMDTLTAPVKEANNNNSEDCFNRNIQKTRSKSLPSKYLPVKEYNSEPEPLEDEELKDVDVEEDPAIAAVTFHSDEEDPETLILPSVKKLASKFNEPCSTRKMASKV